MEKLMSIVKPYYEKLHNLAYQNPKLAPYFDAIEKKTGVSRGYIISGTICVLGIYLIFGYAAELVCNAIGFVYPAYVSVKALESPNKEDDTRWLTYWVVFALFSTCEFFTDILLSWFPFYWLAKCLFLVWCFLPVPWNGSALIYSRVIRPYFLKNQSVIDVTLGDMQNQLGKVAGQAQKIVSSSDTFLKKD